jgi:hypothetical protein
MNWDMSAEPNPKCPVYHFDDCPCRKRATQCPFDMRELSDEAKEKTLELAKRFGWHNSR